MRLPEPASGKAGQNRPDPNHVSHNNRTVKDHDAEGRTMKYTRTGAIEDGTDSLYPCGDKPWLCEKCGRPMTEKGECLPCIKREEDEPVTMDGCGTVGLR